MKTNSVPWIDRLAQRWWVYVLLVVLAFIPAYASRPFNPVDTPGLIMEVFSHAAAYSAPLLFPLFKLITLALVVGLAFRSEIVSRISYLWAGINLLVVAVFQDTAITPSYGLAVLVGNVLLFGLTALLWVRAAFKPWSRGLSLGRRLPWWRYWVLPLALLAFWYPVNTAGGISSPDFSFAGFILNGAGLTFCMMLPVYLALLTLSYPNVDKTVLRISGFVGMLTGLLNGIVFILVPAYGTWMALLHLPLLSISIYAFVLSLKNR